MTDLLDPSNLQLLKAGFDTIKTGLDILRSKRDLEKDSKKRAELDDAIATAEKNFGIAEAELAKALGYNLCRCTFPPQVMLQQPQHPVLETRIYKCPKCGATEPTRPTIARYEANERAWAEQRANPKNNWY